MRPGVYALVSLTGAPLDPEDLRSMGLQDDADHNGMRRAPGLAVRLCDDMPQGEATSFAETSTGIAALAGFLEEAEDLRIELGLPDASPAALAWAAVERFGAAASSRMAGQWTLLHWDVRERKLTLLTSETWRDPVYWASREGRVAVAPAPLDLTPLPWVGREFDPQGVALYLSRAALRRILKEQTVWQGVSRVLPGVREEFSDGEHRRIQPAPEPEPVLWTGSFDEAVEASEAVLRKILREQFRHYGHSAFLLSGGLDSSLTTALGAAERGEHGRMLCITSVASDGSGLPDERRFSAAVAEMLGVPLHLVCPPAHISAYRPAELEWAHSQVPLAGPRHFVYPAMFAVAKAAGARSVVDGIAGELSITIKPAAGTRESWLMRQRIAVSLWRQRRAAMQNWPASAFHGRLSDELLRGLPAEWKDVWGAGGEDHRLPEAGQPFGIHPGAHKSSHADTLTAYGLRYVTPFRDRRLLRLAASFPTEFFQHEGQTRAIARAILRGKIPEEVRVRRRGMAFSPDYELRLHKQAAEARKRLPVFYSAGVDRWIDLRWLEKTLLAAERNPKMPYWELMGLQSTVCAAEFFAWAAQS